MEGSSMSDKVCWIHNREELPVSGGDDKFGMCEEEEAIDGKRSKIEKMLKERERIILEGERKWLSRKVAVEGKIVCWRR